MSDKNDTNRVRKLSFEDKARILAWKEDGVSAAEIADRLGRHHSSIQRLLAKAKSLPPRSIPARKKGSGHPPIITKHGLKCMERYVKKKPWATDGDNKEKVPEVAAVGLHHILKLLVEKLRLPSRVAAQKPLLTKKMKAKRLAFAKKHRNWTEEDWSKVMYSDESTFRCMRATMKRMRRPVGSDRFDSRYTVKTVKYPASLMVWACFSGSYGRGGIFFLPPNVTMNGERYQQVLEDHLLPFMEMHRCSHFLQDGAPCHASKRIKDKPFEVIDWPGNSPDLNPIENAWNFMKNKLSNKDISSIPKLKEALLKMWTQDISRDYLASLSNSMPKRLDQEQRGHDQILVHVMLVCNKTKLF
jgi:transposase